MKKAMSFIVVFAVLILSLSAHTDRVYDTATGLKAPDLTVENSDTALSLGNLRGRYVLLSFWSSADAQSRLDAGRYDTLGAEIASMPRGEERFCLLSVNFDHSERLFREIMRRDKFLAKTHFHVNGPEARQLASVYHLDSGFRSYLIDPQGRIVAVDPTDELIREKLSI